MAVPDYQSLMRPLLSAADQFCSETSVRELTPGIATMLKLNEEDLGVVDKFAHPQTD